MKNNLPGRRAKINPDSLGLANPNRSPYHRLVAIGDDFPLPPVTTKDHRCDECNKPIKLFNEELYMGEGHYKQVVGGICLDFSGGYDEFNDLCGRFSSGEDYADGYVALCHDCTALIYSAIPNAVAKFGFGLHPPAEEDAEKPCCRWSWTLKKVDGRLILFVPDETAENWVRAPSANDEN